MLAKLKYTQQVNRAPNITDTWICPHAWNNDFDNDGRIASLKHADHRNGNSVNRIVNAE
jgi:hypothetical protein